MLKLEWSEVLNPLGGRHGLKQVLAIDLSLASGTYNFPVRAGYLIDEVRAIKTVAFNNTAPTITFGDDDAATGFLTNANVALGSLGAISSKVKTNSYQEGRVKTVANNLKIAFDKSAATSTVGQLYVEVTLVPLPDFLGQALA